MDHLSAGTLVCLAAAGQVLVARPRGQAGWASAGWELRPVPLDSVALEAPMQHGGADDPLRCLPIEALFVLLRRGEQLGFKSLGADGRTIQAVEAVNEPHRIYNHNFGAWESWEEVGDELVNSHWRHKKLGFKVRPVLAMTHDAFGRYELQHAKEVMRLQKQLDKLAGTDTWASRDGQPGPNWELRELESLRRQLAEATRALEHWQREAAVRKVAQEELQSRVEQEQGRRLQALYMGTGSPGDAAATVASLRADLQEAQARHAAQLADLQEQHAQQLDALRQEHASMLSDLLHNRQRSEQHRGLGAWGAADSVRRVPSPTSADNSWAGGEFEGRTLLHRMELLERRLGLAAAERDAAVGEVRAEMQAALHAKDEELHRALMSKDAEVYWLLEERRRLDLALHTIKDMTALVKQASPTGAASGSAGEQSSRGRSPTLLPGPQSEGLTVIGVPLRPGGKEAAAAGGSPGSSASGGHSGAVSIAAEVRERQHSSSQVEGQGSCEEAGLPPPPPQQQQQLGDQPTQGLSGTVAAAAAQPAGGGQGGRASLGRTASNPRLSGSSSAFLTRPPSQLTLVQPWEVQGAIDLGPAAASPDAPAAIPVQAAAQPAAYREGTADAAEGLLGSSGGTSATVLHMAQPALAPGKSRLGPAGSAEQPPAEASAAAVAVPADGLGRPGSASPRPAHHPMFGSRSPVLDELLNPFQPSSPGRVSPAARPAGGRQPAREEQRWQGSGRVAVQRSWQAMEQLRASFPGPHAYNGVGAGLTRGSSEEGSVHRVQVGGGSFLVDYRGPRPDSLTEEAMARILDAPLAPPDEWREGHGARWRGPAQMAHVHSVATTPTHHPCSAPASVAGDVDIGVGSPASPQARGGCGWASGSLSLPGSTRVSPLLREEDRVWQAAAGGNGGALAALPKEQVAARRNRGAGAADLFPPSQAVKALEELSPGAAGGVAQYMADGLTLRASMPEGGWLAGAHRAKARRHLDLHAGSPAEQALRRSAPAGPVPLSPLSDEERGGAGQRLAALRRSTFLTRPPVAVELLYGVP